MLLCTRFFAAAVLLVQDAAGARAIERAELAARRHAFLESFGKDGSVVVLSSRKPRESFGVEWPTDPAPDARVSFFYLVGGEYAGAKLVVRDGRPVLFADPPDPVRAETGFEDVRALSEFDPFLKDHSGGILTETNVEQSAAMASLRQIKSAREIELMRRAAAVSCKAHIKAMRAARPGINEGDFARIFQDTLIERGCDALAYPMIVGGSRNTPVIHYHANNKPVEDGELVLNDSAGSYRGYACDITRTFPINGKFSELQRTQYQAVLDAQKAAEKILKPGVTWQDLSRVAAGVIREAGFGTVSYAKMHGLGHFVGVQTHDLGNYREPLKAGMVMTIEPGIYDKEHLISIRIEDVYLVTPDGNERLSAGAPREIDEIERLIQTSF